jgi:hypothetical protein
VGTTISEELERRVRVAESEIEGEKTVTRYVLQQIRINNDNVIGLKVDVGTLVLRTDRLGDDMTVANAALRNHGMLLTLLQQDVAALRLDATELRRGQEAINARLDAMGLGWIAWRPGWTAWRLGWIAWRPGWTAWRPAWIAWRLGWTAWRPAWIAWRLGWTAWRHNWVAWRHSWGAWKAGRMAWTADLTSSKPNWSSCNRALLQSWWRSPLAPDLRCTSNKPGLSSRACFIVSTPH